MHLRMMTTDDVASISKDHESYVKRHITGIGYFVTSDPKCKNLGSIACHAPYTRGRFKEEWGPQDKKYWVDLNEPFNFITGYTQNNEIDSILFDKEGTYKKLWALSDDLVLVKNKEVTVALKIPDEWCAQYEYHTLLYSFLVQTREAREFKKYVSLISSFMDYGFTLHESYILSYMYEKDFGIHEIPVKWSGCHQIFADHWGIDVQKYTTGEVELWFNGPRTSIFWGNKGKMFSRFIHNPFYMGKRERKFGEQKGLSYPTNLEGLVDSLKKFMRR